MPRLIRRRSARRQYDSRHIAALLSGVDFYLAFDRNGPCTIARRPRPDYLERPDVDQRRREAWNVLGAQIIADYPDRTPWALARYGEPNTG